MRKGFRDFVSPWEDYRSEPNEYRELDGERVLVFSRLSGRGKTSQVELGDLQATMAFLVYIRDGKVTRLVRYFDRDRAFADLGLED
jgi:ketosteroid isomerase-like protein